MLDKFAEELVRSRENNDLTLQQLAAKTRIDIKFLEQMEQGNFSFLPDVYVRAFIKDYSKVTGLDEEKMLKKFEAAKRGELISETEISEEKSDKTQVKNDADQPASSDQPRPQAKPKKEPIQYKIPEKEYSQQKNNINIIYAAAGGVLLVVFALIIYSVFFDNEDDIIVPEKPYEEIIKEEQGNRFEEENPVFEQDTNITAAADSLRLLIQASDTTWIKIIKDNSSVEDFLLFPRSRKNISAKDNFVITLGNSGAVSLFLNDKPLSFTGRRKAVMNFRIDSSGLSQIQNPGAGN